MKGQFRCVVHGSFSKHFSEIKRACQIFSQAGIEVLAPKDQKLTFNNSGFYLFEDEAGHDPRLVELIYLHNLRQLGENGFSYFVNPEGYMGKSVSYELAIAQLTNVRCFFSHRLADHPAYVQAKSVYSAQALADHILSNRVLPAPSVRRNEKLIHKLWQDLMVPGSVVAAGAIIEHQPKTSRKEKEILLVKTHKWKDRYSVVGGKVRRNERLAQALLREVKEETGLPGEIGRHLCTFDQITNSGYYRPGIQHIFIDNIVKVRSKKVILNDEAEDFIWALPSEALASLNIEPNARKTLELYSQTSSELY